MSRSVPKIETQKRIILEKLKDQLLQRKQEILLDSDEENKILIEEKLDKVTGKNKICVTSPGNQTNVFKQHKMNFFSSTNYN